MILTKQMLDKMAQVELDEVAISDLAEISEIKIDASKPVQEKLEQLAHQTQNVYLYRHQDYKIKLTYQKSGPTIDEKMCEYLRCLAEIEFS